jgi:hypothetical protein
MAATTFTADNPTEALLLGQALAFARQLTRVAHGAPDGHVLASAERCVLAPGRDFLRQALATVLQAQADEVEKKGPLSAPVLVDSGGTTKASRRNKR